jgi:hypothetical protein
MAMGNQNITLSIPEDILTKIKLVAAQRQTSVSGLPTRALERLVEQEDTYACARRRHPEWLERGVDLGTGGNRLTQRDELHERA